MRLKPIVLLFSGTIHLSITSVGLNSCEICNYMFTEIQGIFVIQATTVLPPALPVIPWRISCICRNPRRFAHWIVWGFPFETLPIEGRILPGSGINYIVIPHPDFPLDVFAAFSAVLLFNQGRRVFSKGKSLQNKQKNKQKGSSYVSKQEVSPRIDVHVF